MSRLRIFARSADEAIARIRASAAGRPRSQAYQLARRWFWHAVWLLACAAVAVGEGRPLAALMLLAIPYAVVAVIRLLKTTFGLLFLAACAACAIYAVRSLALRTHRFLEGTTFEFVSGKGALVIPHPADVIRLYAEDDFYIGAQLMSPGDEVLPGDRLLIADFDKEVVELTRLQRAIQPKEAYLDYLLVQSQRGQAEARIQLQIGALEHQQVAFEKEQLERPVAEGGRSRLEAYRGLLDRGLLTLEEFEQIEKEYERLKTSSRQLDWQERRLSLDVDEPEGLDVTAKQYRYEKAQLDLLRFQADSQRRWLARIAYVVAPDSPGQASGEPLPGLLVAAAGDVPGGDAEAAGGPARRWERGELIYLAGARSSSRVERGALVAEIWVAPQRKRIGIELPRSKMVGIHPGAPVNFVLDEELGDFDSVVHGRIQKIRTYPDRDSFWIEAGDLAVLGKDVSLDAFPLGLSGNYRIGLGTISYKEKFLKIRDEARTLGQMWSSLREQVAKYVRREAGVDFVASPPAPEAGRE